MSGFTIVGEEAIRRGDCTDIYFRRSVDVLEKEGINPVVTMEVTTTGLPGTWGVFCGLSDALALFEGVPADVDAMPEGSIFFKHEPVVRITGRYRDIAVFETSLLGFLCHASGIASAAAHITKSAGGRPVYSFGSRRQHPAIAAMVERAAWIGGVDGASSTCAPAGIPLAGTMPHAFVMCYPDPVSAWRSFDRHASSDVPRIMLCDTFCDEKREALAAAETGCYAVRLDTPRSRRGSMREIIEEVRWELDCHGYESVKIFLSGGVTQDDVIAYRDIVDAFGVGGAIANAPVIDFALDIVAIEGKVCSKRGKRSGVKQVYEYMAGEDAGQPARLAHRVLPEEKSAPADAAPLLARFIENGKIIRDSGMNEARERARCAVARLPA